MNHPRYTAQIILQMFVQYICPYLLAIPPIQSEYVSKTERRA